MNMTQFLEKFGSYYNYIEDFSEWNDKISSEFTKTNNLISKYFNGRLENYLKWADNQIEKTTYKITVLHSVKN